PISTLFPYTTLFRSKTLLIRSSDFRVQASSVRSALELWQRADPLFFLLDPDRAVGELHALFLEADLYEAGLRLGQVEAGCLQLRSEEHTSELQSRSD